LEERIMTFHSDRIKPDDRSIGTYLDSLRSRDYQIPTFQREVVWEEDSVKKLWDSIYRFYPIGSILVWKTDLQLQNHRAIGGHVIAGDGKDDDFQYILDGQQRTTSLLTSLYGGDIEGRPDFDPTLYFDLTVEDEEEIDDDSYKKRFLFWNEIDDRDGTYTRNTGRMNRHREGLIIKLRDVIADSGSVERRLVEGGHSDWDDPIRRRLREIRHVLMNYRLSFIELKGIEVSEVCQIFERINQEGQPLDIFDIVVAKTFRLETDAQPGFYLRELVEDFRGETPGNFADLGDLTYLQAIAIVLRQHLRDAKIYNVTPTYLNRIRTEHIEAVWPGVTVALRRTFDFLENYLHLKGPRLVPYRYFYLSLVSHFYKNHKPNYEFLKKYFWYYSFHNEEKLRNTTHLRTHADLLDRARMPGKAQLERFLIDREQLRTASYSTRGRLSTAILCLLANQEPRDWATPDRRVLSDVYYVLTSKPNLHHIFPTGFLKKHPGENELDSDSLMNIAYLTQITNLEISAKDPVKYLRKYDGPEFEDVLETNLVPLEILEWAREDEMPEDALDQFIERRIDLMIEELRDKLPGVTFDVIDTKEEDPDADDGQ
jgi:hypothetical protein